MWENKSWTLKGRYPLSVAKFFTEDQCSSCKVRYFMMWRGSLLFINQPTHATQTIDILFEYPNRWMTKSKNPPTQVYEVLSCNLSFRDREFKLHFYSLCFEWGLNSWPLDLQMSCVRVGADQKSLSKHCTESWNFSVPATRACAAPAYVNATHLALPH